MTTDHRRRVLEWLVVAAVYCAAGRLGQMFAIPPGKITAVWPPSGVALAAVLLVGSRVWPGIWLGSFLGNIWAFFDPSSLGRIAISLAQGIAIGAGSTWQALLGAFLIRRWVGPRNPLDRPEYVVRFATVAPLACLVSSTCGIGALSLGATLSWAASPGTWFTWWLGDLIGVFIAAPVILAAGLRAPGPWTTLRVLEAAVAGSLLLGMAIWIFFSPPHTWPSTYPYATIPFVLWVAFRFSTLETGISILLLSVPAAWGTSHGLGPFAQADTNTALLSALVFLGVIAVLGLTVSAELRQRRAAEAALRASHDTLEECVAERKRAEERLRLALLYTRSLIEASLDPLVTISPEGIITDVNEATVRATGASRENLVGSDFSIYFTEPEKARAGYQQVFAKGFVTDYPLTIRHKDGRLTDVLYNASVYRDERGNPLGVFAAARDITEQKRAQETLSRNARELILRNRIAEVFLSVPDEETYTKVLAIILEALESPYGLLGYLDERGGLVVPTMTHPVWGKCQVADKRFVFPRETWGEGSWSTAIGEKRTICVSERPICASTDHIAISRHVTVPILHHGDVVGLIQVANKETDYTSEDVALLDTIGEAIGPALDARLTRERQDIARRCAENDLRRANEELTRSNRELEQFAYVASHELQEPLRMVSSYTQLLARRYKDKLDQDARDYVGYAVDGANRMQGLIHDLLSYSRVTARGHPPTRLDANEAFGEAVANLQVSIRETGALVTNGELPVVLGDRTQVVQVFQNLVGNSIKFRRPSESPRVHVSAQLDSNDVGFWVFKVTDNGIGIDPKYFDRLFVIFQRLHTLHERAGAGIGLALCKRIIQGHGGKIWLESKPGQGTTCLFTLPAAEDEKGER